ncbi:hypothetical protein K474DRAFT_1617378 [Panus rudis PR-1116 ss-1]|nr:hypothetical protein K474DRAFT_1617378 [Panus rudis PR-1116 ss-1]
MSVPTSSSYGSFTASSVRDVIASYRRAQLYLSDSVSASNSGASDDGLEEEDDIERRSVIDESEEEDLSTPRPPEEQSHDMIGNLSWDEDVPSGLSATRPEGVVPILARRSTEQSSATVVPASAAQPTTQEVQENTPLLHKTTSLSFLATPSYSRPAGSNLPNEEQRVVRRAVTRRGSQLSAVSKTSNSSRAAKHLPGGQSTFGQTLFNAIAILLGIGMLSEPLAFAYAGWIGGTLLIISYGLITCYTGKILARIILEDPRLKSYSDIGRKAFGPRSATWISVIFGLDLFTVSVALVTLYADSLHAVVPAYSSNTYKIIGIVILVPTMLMPLSILSYASIIGILSILFIIAIIFIDGLSKTSAPGSLWSPAETSLGVRNLGELGVSFGLFMAGFAGHAVMPSLVRDMQDPSHYDVMIDWAFLAATAIYAVIGVAGYLMFGNDVSDEFSKDLMKIPEYNQFLNQLALWGLVLAPLSKFALATRPLNITIEMLFGIDIGASAPDDHGLLHKSSSTETHSQPRSVAAKNLLIIVERTAFVVASVGVSILIPEFSSMMAFLGAFTSFLLCVIGPLLAKMALSREVKWYDAITLLVAIVMASWGTGAAFWEAS